MTALLLAAGCGDSASSGGDGNAEITVETGSLTKAQFVKRADALCRRAGRQFGRELRVLLRDFGVPQNARSERTAAAALVRTILIPLVEDLIDRISALGAPAGSEEEVAAFLNALQRSLTFAREQPAKFYGRLTTFPEAAKLAREFGMAGCASSLR